MGNEDKKPWPYDGERITNGGKFIGNGKGMSQKIRVGIAGFGLSGSVFHAPFIESMDQFDLKMIQSSRREDVLEKYPNAIVCNNYEELLNSDLDLIIITTPNHLHFEQVKKALNVGKHVLVEKPFVPSVEEGIELKKLAEEKKLVLSVFHNRRFDGDFLTVKKLLEEKVLGDIVYFESHFDRFRPIITEKKWREKSDTIAGGVLWDLGPHLIDQACHLFGTPKEVYADAYKQRENAEQDDYFHLNLKYDSLRVVLHASCISCLPGPRFLIHGTKGSLKIEGLDPQEAWLKEGQNPLEFKKDSKRSGTIFTENAEENLPLMEGDYRQFFSSLAKAVNGEGPNPVGALESLMSLKIISDIYNLD